MGKGKGNPEGFVAPVTPGRIIFEADGVPYAVAKRGFTSCSTEITYYDKSLWLDVIIQKNSLPAIKFKN